MAVTKLTKLELKVMEALWTLGPCAVREVQEFFPEEGRPAYTTVQTMLTVLLRKKKVRRTQAGRGFTYQAAISREGAVGATVTDLVSRMFGGSGEALLMALIDTKQITPEQVARASRLVNGDEVESGDGEVSA